MPNDLENMVERLTEMQMAVVPNSDAVTVDFYAQESPLYWTNQIGSFTTELLSENIQIVTYTIRMRLVLATVTEGFEQEAEKLIQTWLPVVLSYFGKRRQLKRTSADAPVQGLDPRGSLIIGGTARHDIQNSGIGQLMHGIDFDIEVPMTFDTDQVIW